MTRALSIASLHSSLKVYDLESPGRVGLLGHWRSIGLSESSWPAREIQEAFPLARSQGSLDFERFTTIYHVRTLHISRRSGHPSGSELARQLIWDA